MAMIDLDAIPLKPAIATIVLVSIMSRPMRLARANASARPTTSA